jgi:hypothetical protein
VLGGGDPIAAFLFGQHGVLAMNAPGGDEEATARIRTISRVITDRPALLARDRQVFDLYARDLGGRPGDVVCHVVANTLLGLHRASIDYVRDQALAGAQPPGSGEASAARPNARSRNSSTGCATWACATRVPQVADNLLNASKPLRVPRTIAHRRSR